MWCNCRQSKWSNWRNWLHGPNTMNTPSLGIFTCWTEHCLCLCACKCLNVAKFGLLTVHWPFAIWGSRRKLNHLPLFTIVDPYILSLAFLPWHRRKLLGCKGGSVRLIPFLIPITSLSRWEVNCVKERHFCHITLLTALQRLFIKATTSLMVPTLHLLQCSSDAWMYSGSVAINVAVQERTVKSYIDLASREGWWWWWWCMGCRGWESNLKSPWARFLTLTFSSLS